MFGRRKPLASAKRTVLLVEDQTPVRVLLVTTLSRQGYHVLAAADGPDALLKAAEYEGPIDLLLTDMVMPQMSGSALCERLSKIRPEMRVLYTSGYAGRATQLELGRQALSVSGVKGLEPDDCFLAKPFGVTDLVAKVTTLLNQPTPALVKRPALLATDTEPARPSFATLRQPPVNP